MSNSFRAKYLEALKTSFNDWLIVSERALRFGELHPDLLEKAEYWYGCLGKAMPVLVQVTKTDHGI